ncbi:glycoside hydrolase family 35 protein [Virgibacillus halodenitrificans]|uniref:Beta-galactosidase n=1 Tax=Virgibacillus halodenitrificans TaxID=1482 RepID=A0ABR7VHD0_VIRHA|nr:beta-galactosidase family protein [Virgibacillus halodenitrificans]MBD1221339.1 beta-galactosidase [Virgibacillus halodenitrificans]
MTKLTVVGKELYLHNKPFQIISGAIHYFRIVPAYWEDRLLKLKACGFNCVETYVPWNLHEPEEGKYQFSGIADLEAFVQIAAKLDLYVILRPSPYICAEWEYGGLPAWLLSDRNMRVRTSYPDYLKKIDRYYNVLLPKIKPLLSTNDGPIIALQIENEYGSYGNDKKYLSHLKESMLQHGMDVLLFTSDGPRDLMLQGGTIDGALPTVNFGSRPEEAFTCLQDNFPGIPNIVMEFWNGWFDHWGEHHHTRDAGDAIDVFTRMMENGDSVNFYMFHGGTNFGFYNGANFGKEYAPTVTSYDYDCPVSESGDLTDKYYAVREVIAKTKNIQLPDPPAAIPKMNYGTIDLDQSIDLFSALDVISQPVNSSTPKTMEEVGQAYGFILYRTYINIPADGGKLSIKDVGDRAQIYLNGVYQGVIDRWDNKILEIKGAHKGAQLDILVENMGRVNYGANLYDRKGITEGVQLNYQYLFDWEIYKLPLDQLAQLTFSTENAHVKGIPTFYKGSFSVEKVGDTFVELNGWEKGVVFINGFNLGRYWEIGPQQTLYLPGPLLRQGSNEIIVFELSNCKQTKVSFIDQHKLG